MLQDSITLSSFVIPGQILTAEQGFLRGHGTYVAGTDDLSTPKLVASVGGKIERVNKLLSVRPAKARYVGEIGDLVVGRITAVESKRWKTDIKGQKDAILMLSSVNLPGGVQRMRTYEDQLQMRELYQENDLISAEIQNISSDGMISLHTRSLKYGKLENGQLVEVPAALIARLPQHYVTLPGGVDVILGLNGLIWITRSIPDEWKHHEEEAPDSTPLAETLQRLKLRHRDTPLLNDQRLLVAKVKNAILALSSSFLIISPESICQVLLKAEDMKLTAKDMIVPDFLPELVSYVKSGMNVNSIISTTAIGITNPNFKSNSEEIKEFE